MAAHGVFVLQVNKLHRTFKMCNSITQTITTSRRGLSDFTVALLMPVVFFTKKNLILQRSFHFISAEGVTTGNVLPVV